MVCREQRMRHYPLFLDLRGTHCLVVGAGSVGLRKTESLLACDAGQVLVLDTAPLAPAWSHLLADERLVTEQRAFVPGDVTGRALVFAATSLRAANEAVRAACAAANVWCNVADDPEGSRFMVPACARHGRLAVAISTAGASPALARLLRRDLDELLCRRYAPLAEVLARLRPLALAPEAGLRDQAARADLFRAVVESTLAEHLASGNRAACDASLRDVLPPALCAHIPELLHELA